MVCIFRTSFFFKKKKSPFLNEKTDSCHLNNVVHAALTVNNADHCVHLFPLGCQVRLERRGVLMRLATTLRRVIT